MALRVLKRKVIIREYDFEKVKSQALGNLVFDGMALYDRVSFTPLSADGLEKLKLQELLKGKTGPLTQIDPDKTIPALLLYQLKDYLYSEKYYNWQVTIDEEGYLCVQARKNTPKSRIGWGVFEKDLVSRI